MCVCVNGKNSWELQKPSDNRNYSSIVFVTRSNVEIVVAAEEKKNSKTCHNVCIISIDNEMSYMSNVNVFSLHTFRLDKTETTTNKIEQFETDR